MDKLENLKKLKQLFDNGVLSEKEYSEMKNEVLGNSEKPMTKPIELQKDDSKNESPVMEPKNILELIIQNSTLIDGVYLTEDENLVKSLKFMADISGWSGWSGFAENLGIKNAEKKLINKAKDVGANVVLIIGSSADWGVKIKGKAYKL